MTGDNSQKFIARNRAPRVQIEYDVELYGSEKKVQLPFVMGVMSDLAGKSRQEQPAVADRKFLEIDVETFDARMKAMAPRVAFAVPNTLTGEGNLEVDLTFESMRDFSPAAIAAKVDALRPLLEARQQLANLMAYMDGKSGAEALIEKILANPSLLAAVSGAQSDEGDHAAALDSLRALATDDSTDDDTAAGVLDSLRAQAPAQADLPDVTVDVLGALRAEAPEEPPETGADTAALDSLRAQAAEDALARDDMADVLGALRDVGVGAGVEAEGEDTGKRVLDALRTQPLVDEAARDTTDDLLADLAADAPPDEAVADATADALDSLAGLDLPDEAEDTTDDLLADLAADAPPDEAGADATADALDSLAGLDLLDDADDTTDDLLADLAADAPPDEAVADATADALDSLADLDLPDDAEDTTDDLLADLAADAPPDEAGADAVGLDDLLADLDLGSDGGSEMPGDTAAGDGDGLDDLLGDLEAGMDDEAPDDRTDGDPPPASATAELSGDPEFAFGRLGAARPEAARLNRKRFRLAILGDFSGRAARGMLDTGDALAARKALLLDPDTAEDVIAGFATDLVLPIGRDGAGIAVRLRGLDDLHPDELFENVGLFAELAGLRRQLASGATAENAARRLKDWGAAYGTPVAPPRTRSSGNAVPADRKLSDFQKLIGDTAGRLVQASPIDDLLARVVGPHIRAMPDPNAQAMQAAIDDALSAAMRMLLHHPEFQSVEAQWRSIDLIARSIETDDTLDVMLYDISAEEIAADLASSSDLSQSGLARLLTGEPLDEDTGRGGYSALIGLYSFEETPPHAELLGRIARVAAHVDAPFVAAISPAFLDTDKKDRHPLVAQAWDGLRAMPEARHLALASPRFLLRRPYGAKTEPTYAFTFEEFTMSEGLGGMLWANPAVLVAILLAQSFRKNGASMNLGSVMSLGGMPYHYVTDRHGDQVALPCTERNLTQAKVEIAMARGLMPVVSFKGRDEIRLGSFQSLGGGDILGPWTGEAPPAASAPRPVAAARVAGADDAAEGDRDVIPGGDDGDIDLDDLLSGFGDQSADDEDSDGIDADLAALLDDL